MDACAFQSSWLLDLRSQQDLTVIYEFSQRKD